MPEQEKDYTQDPRFPIFKLKAENHWAEYRRRTMRELKKEGRFDQVISELVTSALRDIDQLRAAGVQKHVINEIVLPQYIYLPEDSRRRIRE